MTPVPTAEDLLARVAGRDADALGELYDSLAPSLFGMLLRILGERSAAEEVLDDVFVELWNHASGFARQRSSVPARLAAMARHAATRRVRFQRMPRPVELDDCGFVRFSLSCLPQPDEIAALEQRRDLLKKVMKQLPEAQRQALELAVFEGYTEAEIAAKLGEPLGRTKSALRAALRFLRHRLRAVLGTWTANI
jgi:RNA polymerase sigma-70 factor (ECF subfamily)